jgi:hypothetical protein
VLRWWPSMNNHHGTYLINSFRTHNSFRYTSIARTGGQADQL